jgi:hypothetical protein
MEEPELETLDETIIEPIQPIVTPTPSAVEIARVPVAQLRERFGKRKFYDEYLKVLRITPTKAGKFSYVSQQEALLIEEYHLARSTSDEAKQKFLDKHGLSQRLDIELDDQSLSYSTTDSQDYFNRSNLSYNQTYEAPLTSIPLDLINLANCLDSFNPIARHLAVISLLKGIAVAHVPLTSDVIRLMLNKKILRINKSGKFSWAGFDFIRPNFAANHNYSKSSDLWFVSCQIRINNATTDSPEFTLSPKSSPASVSHAPGTESQDDESIDEFNLVDAP